MPEQSKPMSPAQAKLVKGGLVSGAALALAVPLIQQWEGTRLNPYRDIVGVWTVCTGETRVEMRKYTPAECDTMLRKAVTSEYGAAALKAVPALENRPYQLAASISLTYNIGQSAFARSTVAKRFNRGDWKGGCEAFMAWRFAGGKEVKGLANRRRDERKLCLTDL